jgi:hypothetical protein
MYRLILFLLAVATALGVSVGMGHASSSLQDTLSERFMPSHIEVQIRPPAGASSARAPSCCSRPMGSLPTRCTSSSPTPSPPAIPKPRVHVGRYARVEVGRDGQLTAAPGELSLAKGTRLVVLDLKVGADRVHLFTHTLEPVRMPDGKTAYGCAEFVFVFDPATLERADAGTVAGRIDQWLVASAR